MSAKHRKPQRRRHEPRQIIIAKGDEVSVFHLRGWMIAGGVVLMLAAAFWMTATTAYIFFRDDVLAAVLARQTRMQHAYEDRIATLRLQIDRVTSRQLLDQEAFMARMDELMRRQQAVESRSQAVQGVIERARTSGLASPPAAVPGADPVVTGSLGPALRAATDRGARIHTALEAVDGAIGRIAAAQDAALGQIEARSREQQARIGAAVRELGLTAETLAGPRLRTAPLPAAPPAARSGGVGGPFLPVPDSAAAIEPLETRARRVQEELDYLERLRRGLAVVPVRRPVKGTPELTSGFGQRRDPFLGVMAMHTGVDFRGETGDPVVAAAAGVVTSAGRNGGYGLMVEIDHGNNLTTRYGHLSHVAVREGQRVAAGHQIGKVGSTGRSTGPHLHYETRVDGDAVNPERFMRAGRKLNLW